MRDSYKAGRSKLVPYVRGEDASRRHGRRLSANNRSREIVEEWCEKHGITLTVTNGSHHWKFEKGKKIAEWWPSSAKLVINKRWGSGIHTHDWEQLMKILETRWKLETINE
jgi:hypothetical protein